jgi:hypothetical protein
MRFSSTKGGLLTYDYSARMTKKRREWVFSEDLLVGWSTRFQWGQEWMRPN